MPIVEILYLEYELLFIFDNITSYVIYAKDVLQITHINKSLKGWQIFFTSRVVQNRQWENNHIINIFIK